MSRYWTAEIREIEHLCSYIRDDGAVAAYFGIDRERVRSVRANMRVTRFKNTEAGHHPDDCAVRIVDRSPCPRCGVRRDIGCGHTAERLVA